MRKGYFLALSFLVLSCKNQTKFDKTAWVTKDDFFPCKCRDLMVEDLTNNHKLIGINGKELKNFLGNPDSEEDLEVNYDLIIDYGSDIDPVYNKYLSFKLNKDSLVESYKIIEWKK